MILIWRIFNEEYEAYLYDVGDFKIREIIINEVKFADSTAIVAKTQKELQDMVNRLVNTGRKDGMEIKFVKSLLMSIQE